MGDTIYGEFIKKVRKTSTADDLQYNMALLFGIVASHPEKVSAARRGAVQYLLFSKVGTALGKPALQAADENNGTYVITILPPTGDGTVAASGIDFHGNVNTEKDFVKTLEQAFSW